MLTIFHLRKLYKDFTKTNIEALRVHRLFSIAVKSEKQARSLKLKNGTGELAYGEEWRDNMDSQHRDKT